MPNTSALPLALLLLVLHVATDPAPAGQQSPDAPAPVSARVSVYNGRPTFFLNEKPVYPMLYALTDVPGGRWSWEELPQRNIRNFYQAGVRLFQVDLWLDHVWRQDGTMDLTLARKQIAGIRDVCPDAGVVIRFHVTAPRWWMHSHPEEWVRYADTDYIEEDRDDTLRILERDNFPVRRVSMASGLWKKEASEKTRAFLHALAATPEGGGLAGIQVANGIYGEWHNWGFFRNEPDTSVLMTRFFRSWLKQHYRSEEALRKAWNNPQASFPSARVPDMAARRTQSGIIRDPARERATIDYYTCVHELVADNIIHFAQIVKETWPRPIVTGTFYGYYFSTFGRQAAGGHLELQRVLASPSIDYLSGPQAYEPESLKPGEPYRSRSLIASIRLHGKLWLDEMDQEPTIPSNRDPNRDALLRSSIATVRRNVLFTWTKGMGLWFYDFGVSGVDLDGFHSLQRGTRGNWDHPRVLQDIGTLRKLLEQRLAEPYRTEADVLVVYDTRAFYHTASLRGADPVSNVLIDFSTLHAFKSGVVFDPVHLDDLDRIDLTPYRVVVFGNTFVLSDAQRELIRRRVARDGRTIIWCYAPGYSDGSSLDAARISEVTGIRVSPLTLSQQPVILSALPQDSSVTFTVGSGPFSPLFAVNDPEAVPLGYYQDSRQVALARKSFPDHTSWYLALPNTGIEPFRTVLRQSGAHVYTRAGEIAYAGAGILAVHTKESGRHTVTLKDGRSLTFDLSEGGGTIVLDSRTGRLLMPNP